MELLLVNDHGVPGIVQVDEICMVIPTKNGPEFVTRWGNFHYPQTAAELISQFSCHSVTSRWTGMRSSTWIKPMFMIPYSASFTSKITCLLESAYGLRSRQRISAR